MKPTTEQRDDFLANRPVTGLKFAFKDYVNATGGDYAGASGSIIDIEELGKDSIYRVKLESDEQVFIAASHLQPEGEN